MTWFRSRLRSFARLALFALAFQMAVSFGHMDADELGLSSVDPVSRTHLALNAFEAAVAPAAPDRAPAVPEGYCPICASIALVATAFPSAPPVLPVPPRLDPVWQAQPPVHSIAPRFAFSFQARAPPAA
jgi:hypothetical protein